jgi:hypothetical protein
MVLLALLVAVAVATARAAVEPSLAGTYRSKGLNPDGSEYEGVVRIARHGDSFVVEWMSAYATGRATVFVPTSVGVGVMSGGMLAVSYYSDQVAGVVLYRIEENGRRLSGNWAIVGASGNVSTETLTKVPDADVAPDGAAPPPSTEHPQPHPPAHRHLRPGDRAI